MTVEADIATLHGWISEAKPNSVVFFGGAGVSTESGIPDFRSADGLYHLKYPVSPEEMISRSYFDAHPERFFDFYFDRMIFPDAEPNQAHRKLAQLEDAGILSCVITQNIDGLHQRAGSDKVHELHGSVLRNHCMSCNEAYGLDDMVSMYGKSRDGIPHCMRCGSIVKPDVVLYEESLDGQVIEDAIKAIASAETLIIAGTSLVVYPAAGFIDYFQGDHLAIVNLSPTSRDKHADLCISAPVGEVFDF